MDCSNSTTYKTINSIMALDDEQVKWFIPFNALDAQSRYVNNDTHFWITKERDAAELLFDRDEATLEVSSKDGRPGTLYTCTLKYTITDPSEGDMEDVESQTKRLRKAKHLLIKFRGGAMGFVRMCDPIAGYRFSCEDSGEKITCKISIANLTGMQRASIKDDVVTLSAFPLAFPIVFT